MGISKTQKEGVSEPKTLMSKKAFIEFGAYIKPNLSSWLYEGWHAILVEPHPLHLIKLMNYLESLEGVSYDVYAAAVRGTTGNCVEFFSGCGTFAERDESSGCKIHNRGFYWGNHPGTGIKIFPITLDMLVRESPYPVERLEIDCEGAEREIFENYSFHKKPMEIKVACHGKGTREFLTPIFENQNYFVEQMDQEHIFCKLLDK